MPADDEPAEQPGELDSRTLEAIQNLNIIPDMVADARYTGIHSSKDRGGDVEFAEHRQYEPGDDLRHLDWNALAKTDELFLKQYESETQITGRLYLDASESMGYGSGEVDKWSYATALTVLVASTLLDQKDTVELTLSGDNRWESGSLSEIGDLKNHLGRLRERTPTGPTTLPDDMRQSPSNQRSVWFVVSDFWLEDRESFFQWIRGLRERGHDVVLIPVWDPIERNFDVNQPVELRDVETGETLHVGGEDRERFQESLQSYRDSLRSMARSAGITFWPFYTDRELFERYREYVLEGNG